MGPLQLGSRDQGFSKKILYIMGHNSKNARQWREHIENTKMAKFEVPSIKEKISTPVWIFEKNLSTSMDIFMIWTHIEKERTKHFCYLPQQHSPNYQIHFIPFSNIYFFPDIMVPLSQFGHRQLKLSLWTTQGTQYGVELLGFGICMGFSTIYPCRSLKVKILKK